MAETYSAGIVTAYGAAVRGGYTGTYEQWCQDMAQLGDNVSEVREKAAQVEQTAQRFTQTIIPAAIQSVENEGTAQIGAVDAAGAAQVQAVETAGTTQTGNVNTAGAAQVQAVNDEGVLKVGAVEAAGAAQVQAVEDAGTDAEADIDAAKAAAITDLQAESTTQQAAIQQKGEDTRASIPDDYTALSDEVVELKSTLNDIGENTVIQGTNLFDGNFDESGYFNANGNQSSSTYKRTSKYYEIPENATKIYAYLSTQTAAFTIGFYDSTKTWTTAKNVNNATTKENDIPSNSKYFRVYTKTDWNGNCTLATSYVNSYIPYVEPKNKFILNGAFKGKTIAFFGDSLIGNFNDYNSICGVLAEITDATIINCAFGGSRMAYVYSAYGDATPGATGYIDGATDAEKNQVDQYRYWNTLSGYGLAQAIASGSWTAQENAVANMSGALAYFSARLAEIKAIDWTTIDYILWEYGTNDFATKVKVSDTSNLTNYFAFDNAYRKTIETILTAYPKIKIIPITVMWRWWSNSGTFVDDSSTHTENDYSGTPQLLTSFVETAKDVAKENQLPCIDIYYNLGANKFNRLEFFNSTDGTHPNADGRNKYANFVASQLNTLKTS